MKRGDKNNKASPLAELKRDLRQDSMKRLGELVKFSFKYLIQTERFNFDEQDSDYFIELLLRLKAISQMRALDFKLGHHRSLRCHPISWPDTTEPKGFQIPDEEALISSPYQFALSANEHGSVHGFMIENRFYVVWIDKEHRLYSSK